MAHQPLSQVSRNHEDTQRTEGARRPWIGPGSQCPDGQRLQNEHGSGRAQRRTPWPRVPNDVVRIAVQDRQIVGVSAGDRHRKSGDSAPELADRDGQQKFAAPHGCHLIDRVTVPAPLVHSD